MKYFFGLKNQPLYNGLKLVLEIIEKLIVAKGSDQVEWPFSQILWINLFPKFSFKAEQF